MIRKRLLIVSHVFAPSNHANAKRPLLMAKYFAAKGWKVTVLTSRFQTPAEAVSGVLEEGIEVRYLKAWTVNALNQVARFPKFKSLMMSLFQATIFPDTFAPWIRKVAREASKLEYDFAVLNVLPYASFLMHKAGAVDRRWVVDYQESVYPFLLRRPRTSFLQKLWTPRLFELERQALQASGGAWFTSQSNRQRYISDGVIEEQRSLHVPYFFDPAMYPEQGKRTAGESIHILYAGRLDASWRSPATFFKSWSALQKIRPETVGKVMFVLYGTLDEACWQLAEELGLKDYIECRASIDFTSYLAQLCDADLLLYIDARDQEFFNPSKLTDYFGAQRPILAFTAEGSDVEGMLRTAGMADLVAELKNEEQGCRNLVKYWDERGAELGEGMNPGAFSIDTICDQASAWLSKLGE